MRLPGWLIRLLPIWDYICPKCQKEVPQKSCKCPHCGEKYGLPLRVPPRMLKDKTTLEEYVHKKIFPRVSAAYRTYLTQFFTTYFSDGFESGDLSAWTGTRLGGSGAIAVNTDYPHTGSYSVKLSGLNVPSDYAGCYKTLASSYGLLYMREYVYYTSWPTSSSNNSWFQCAMGFCYGWPPCDDANVIYQPSSSQFGVRYRNSSNNWLNIFQTGTTSVSTNTWYCIELYESIGTNGHISLWWNGTLIIDSAVSAYTANLNNVLTGTLYLDGNVSPTLTYYIDDVIVSDSYNGPIGGGNTYPVSVSETSISVSDSPALSVRRNMPVSETSISVSDSPAYNVRKAIAVSETSISVSDSPAYNTRRVVAVSEASITVSDSITRVLRAYRTVSEPSISVSDSPSAILNPHEYDRSVSETSISVSDSVGLILYRARSVSEPSISVSDSPARVLWAYRTVSEPSITVSDSPSRAVFRTRSVSETSITISDSSGQAFIRARTVSEPSIAVSDSPIRVLWAKRSVTESPITVQDQATVLVPTKQVIIIQAVTLIGEKPVLTLIGEKPNITLKGSGKRA